MQALDEERAGFREIKEARAGLDRANQLTDRLASHERENRERHLEIATRREQVERESEFWNSLARENEMLALNKTTNGG